MAENQTFCQLFHVGDRQAVARRARARMAAVLDDPDTAGAVAALGERGFYDLYQEVGPADAVALLEYATPAQVQTCLDMDIWRNDEISDDALTPWVEQLLTVPDEKFAEIWNNLDPEIMALYLHRNLELYMAEDRNDEVEIPDEDSKNIAQTPDFSYWVAYPDDPDKAEVLRRLVDRLYAVLGIEKAWSTLEGMHWEMSSDLEENACRFRTARLREFGIMPRDEAAAIFAAVGLDAETDAVQKLAASDAALDISPFQASWRAADALACIDGSPAHACFFARLLSELDDVEPIRMQLLSMTQQIAVYEGFQPHEREDLDDCMILAVSTVNLGLEYASGRKTAMARRMLCHVPLRRLFAIGWNVVLSLHRKAKILVSRGHLSIIEDQKLSLLTPEQRDCVEGMLLAQPRPRQSAGTPFMSLEDIQSCAAVIADVATRELFYGEGLHKTKDDISLLAYSHELVFGVEGVNFDNLAITFLTLRAMRAPDPWNVFQAGALPKRQTVLDAVSIDNVRALFKSSMPDTTETALRRFARQLHDEIVSQWPQSCETPDIHAVDCILIAQD